MIRACLALCAALLLVSDVGHAATRHHRRRAGAHQPDGVPVGPPLYARTVRAMDEALAAAFPAREPGAVALVSRFGRVELRKAYGLADPRRTAPLTPTAVFGIGSLSESFTAAAVLQLAAEGQLALAEPVPSILPGFAWPVSVEQLLTHTSGIPEAEGLAACPPSGSPRVAEDLRDAFRGTHPRFDPGTDWAECGADYALLARVIERRSGEPFADHLRRRLFGPLTMTQSGCDVPAMRAGSFRREAGVWTTGATDQGPVSCVDDLQRWCEALDQEQICDHELLERAFTPTILPDGRATQYGYGFALGWLLGHATLERSAAGPGVSAALLRLRDERLTVILLSTREGEDLGRLARSIATIALGVPYREPGVVAPDAAQLARLVGTYQAGGTWVVTAEGGRLFAQRGSEPRIELLPRSANEFAGADGNAWFEFALAPSEPASTLTVRGRIGPPEIGRRAAGPPAAQP